jgi:hypothetical protein
MAAVEGESAGIGAVAAEGIEHLTGELGQHRGVVFAVDQERIAAGAHTSFDVGHGADRRPVFAKFVHGDVVAEAFPDVCGGHALADDVGEISGNVEETAGADGFVVDHGDVTDGRTDASTEDAEIGIALLFEPAKTTARVLDGLAIGLKSKAKVRTADLVGALVAAGHAAIVVRQTHFERRDAETLKPFAEAILAMPFGIPIREHEDGGAARGGTRRGPEAGVDGVVLWPWRFDGAGKGEDIFGIKAVVIGGRGSVPIFAGFNGPLRVIAKEGGRIRVVGDSADVLKAPEEGLNATVVIGGPAAVLVAADFLLEPVHGRGGSPQFTVGSEKLKETKRGVGVVDLRCGVGLRPKLGRAKASAKRGTGTDCRTC